MSRALRRQKQPQANTESSETPPVEALRRRVELTAYFRYCERGRCDGADIDDWLAAERDVLAEGGGDEHADD